MCRCLRMFSSSCSSCEMYHLLGNSSESFPLAFGELLIMDSASQPGPHHVGRMAVDPHHAHPQQRHVFQVQRLLKTTDIERLPAQLSDQLAYGFLCRGVPAAVQ